MGVQLAIMIEEFRGKMKQQLLLDFIYLVFSLEMQNML